MKELEGNDTLHRHLFATSNYLSQWKIPKIIAIFFVCQTNYNLKK